LFDTARPQGVPWPDKKDAVLYKPALPGRYRKVTEGLGIVGAIEIECSPWLEDNQWVLDVAAKDPIIVGTIGDLEPGHPEFRAQLEQLARNPLFRGIRYGNLWGRDLGAELEKPEFIGGLKALAEAGLALDTANPTPALITDVARLTDRVPNLRVVMDHCRSSILPPQRRRPAGACQTSAGLRQGFRSAAPRGRPRASRYGLLPGQTRCNMGYLRRGPADVWQ
jgi:L-fuconolactonase